MKPAAQGVMALSQLVVLSLFRRDFPFWMTAFGAFCITFAVGVRRTKSSTAMRQPG